MQLPNTTRQSLGTQLKTLVENGTGVSNAKFQNTGQTATYATCPLPTTAFTVSTAGVLTLQGTPTETNVTTPGTTTRCGFYDGATTPALVFTLSVNDTGSPDMSISNNQLQSGDQVEISSLTITVPAGTLP